MTVLGCMFLATTLIRAAGPWEMAQVAAPEEWMPAVVPGTVLATLVENGIVSDPYVGLNNRREDGTIEGLTHVIRSE